LNGAARIASALPPRRLLDALLAIEAELGRERRERWGARTIDLDLLWSARPFADDRLTLPHPSLTERWFALLPLLDVAPELAERYAPVLSRTQPPPAEQARVAPPALRVTAASSGLAIEVSALDLADAVATALGACGRALRDPQSCGRSELLVLRGACEAGREIEAIAAKALDAARRFAFDHAVVLSLAPGSYDARLIGGRSEAGDRRPIAGVSIHFLGPRELRLDVALSD
jgi:hypothetical protein